MSSSDWFCLRNSSYCIAWWEKQKCHVRERLFSGSDSHISQFNFEIRSFNFIDSWLFVCECNTNCFACSFKSDREWSTNWVTLLLAWNVAKLVRVDHMIVIVFSFQSPRSSATTTTCQTSLRLRTAFSHFIQTPERRASATTPKNFLWWWFYFTKFA